MLVKRGGKLIAVMGLKMRIPTMPRDSGFGKHLREKHMRDNPYGIRERNR